MINYFLIFIALIVIYIVISYNKFIRYSNQIKNALGSTDVMLKKRFDLIPNLVQAIEGYMKHEKGVLTDLARIRTEAVNINISNEEKVNLGNQLTAIFGKIFISVENYPDLKASANFLHLQKSLAEIEEQISAARRTYNSSVTDYNNLVEIFPTSILANIFGFSSKSLLTTLDNEKQLPIVEINRK